MAKGPESELQSAVIQLAQMRGWIVHHSRPAQNKSGKWSTPLQGDAGLPDLIMAKGGRVLFWELKSDTNYLEPKQKIWRDALIGGNVEFAVIRPRDLDSGLVAKALMAYVSDLPQK